MKKLSREQFELLVDYMERNGDLCLAPFMPGVRASWCNQEKWQELTDLLNSQEDSVCKTPDKWRRTWIDIKNTLKRKMFRINKGQLGHSVSDLEQRIYKLIPNKIPARKVHTFSAEEAKLYPENLSEVKLASDKQIEEAENNRMLSSSSNSQPEKRKCSEDANDKLLKMSKTVENPMQERIIFEDEIEVNQSDHLIVIEVKPDTPNTLPEPHHILNGSKPVEDNSIYSLRRPSSSYSSDSDEEQFIDAIKIYFQNEREKERELHLREMTKIKENQKVVSMVERAAKVIESLVPNVLNYFDS